MRGDEVGWGFPQCTVIFVVITTLLGTSDIPLIHPLDILYVPL